MKKTVLALVFGFILLPIALCAIVGEVLQGTGKLVGGVGEGVERLGDKLAITNQKPSRENGRQQPPSETKTEESQGDKPSGTNAI